MNQDLESSNREAPLIGDEKFIENLEEATSGNGYKDVFFLFLFCLHLLILGAISLTYGSVTLFNSGAEYWIVKSNGAEVLDTSYDGIPFKLVMGLMLILFIAALLSIGWIVFLSQVATQFLNFVITFITAGTAIFGIIVLFLGYPYFAFVLVLLALGMLTISYYFQNRIEFASLNLQIACKAILAIPATFTYSIYMLLIQAGFIVIWALAAVGFATNASNITKTYQGKEYYLEQCSSYKYSNNFQVDGISLTCNGGQCYSCICDGTLVSSNSPCFTPKLYYSTMFFLVLSLFWVCSVAANVVHCTTSAAVYSWWSTGSCSDESLKHSFEKITSKSLGSICFGSLLSALIRTFRSFISFAVGRMDRTNSSDSHTVMSNLNRISRNILLHISQLLDRVILYFNRYAFCFVAIYGISYLHAAKSAFELFKARGLTALFNDDMIDLVLLVSEVIISVVCVVIAYIYARIALLTGTYLYLFTLCAFFTGFAISVVILSIIQSAVTTVYVSFAKNPIDFEIAHPTLYAPLANSWIKIFPGCLNLSETRNLHKQTKTVIETSDDSSKRSYNASNNSSNATIRGSYNPPEFSSGSYQPSLYSSMLQMVNKPSGGYSRLSTNEEENDNNNNGPQGNLRVPNQPQRQWIPSTAVNSLGHVMKELARDPFYGKIDQNAAPNRNSPNPYNA